MKAFAPNTHLVLQGLADMAKQFEQWSSTIAESDGFKKFIEYVQENGPKLIQLIGNIINILINVGVAMAPLASLAVSYTHLTLPTTRLVCRSRWSPYH